jgi:hypothetical protein
MSRGISAERAWERSPVTNPLQIRFSQLTEDRRRIDAELRELRHKMRVGVCEVCGKEFTRARVTKRYCSMACGNKAAPSRRDISYDLVGIASNIEALEVSGMLTPSAMEVLRVLANRRNTHSVADLVGVSHQRVSQIAAKATKVLRTIQRIKAAVLVGAGTEAS